MKRLLLLPLLIAAAPAREFADPVEPPKPALSPNEIVAAAPASDWVAIAASNLLVMDLPPLGAKPRRVVIQLMPPPFSQGWVGNIRKLAVARWWDGTSINRVQDNYVVQWGDATEKKALPPELATVPESDYLTASRAAPAGSGPKTRPPFILAEYGDAYTAGSRSSPLTGSGATGFSLGWPVAMSFQNPRTGGEDSYTDVTGRIVGQSWPVHCYGMVGVGRDMPPNTGSGAELYTVIGHAPRHLDRNIALVGRVIEGIEHLSSLPRGTGALGFYEKAEERVGIVSIRIGNEIADLPRFEYLSTESASFARYADARANRRDAFFIQPAGGADICNIPVPVRRIN